jgi:hypothetical protein
MGQLLKQSTAVNITVLMIDSSDHVTGKTGLTLTIYATKAAGTPGSISPTVTELDSTNVKGLYKLALTTSHTDTLGELQLHVTATGADPTDVTHQVIAADLADSVRLGLTALPNAAAEAAGGLYTRGTGAGQIAQDANGRIDSNAKAWAGTATTLTAGLPDVNTKTAAAAVIQAFWDALTSALTTAGSIGKLLVDNINAAITSRLASASYTAPPTAANIADAVWDETMSDHLAGGSTGSSLNAAGSAGDPWATTVPGAYGAGTAGYRVGNGLDTNVGSRLAAGSYTAPPSANDNADALLDRSNGIETGWSMRHALRIVLAALGGKLSGAGTTAVNVRNATDTKTRITATVDAAGNRSAVTLDGTD